MKTRGLRNNNPGNIRRGEAWQGMAPVQSDAEFVTFESPVWGIRAMNRILSTYYHTYGLKTVRDIISRWAPPAENDTPSYINAVANDMGVSPTATLRLPEQAPALTAAIIHHENGLQPYSEQTVAEGVARGWGTVNA